MEPEKSLVNEFGNVEGAANSWELTKWKAWSSLRKACHPAMAGTSSDAQKNKHEDVSIAANNAHLNALVGYKSSRIGAARGRLPR